MRGSCVFFMQFVLYPFCASFITGHRAVKLARWSEMNYIFSSISYESINVEE
jgi:hypothetical protein